MNTFNVICMFYKFPPILAVQVSYTSEFQQAHIEQAWYLIMKANLDSKSRSFRHLQVLLVLFIEN